MLSNLAGHAEKLYYFYEVAQAGSLQSCSRKIGASAPTISYSIKQLEEVTKTKLFIRGKQGVSLTLSGNILFNFCTKYFQELDDIQILMKNSSEKPVTRIRVGTFQSIAIYFWPLLLTYIKENPLLSVTMKTGRSQDMVDSLMRHEIDVALTVEGSLYPETIRHELYRDEYCTYASSEFKLNRVSKKKIKEMTLLYIPDALDQDGISLRQHLYMTDLQVKEIFELDSFEVIAEFVRKNYGLGILPRKVAVGYGDSLKEIRLEGTAKKRFGKHRFFLSYRKDLDLPQSTMDLFVNSANQAVIDMNA